MPNPRTLDPADFNPGGDFHAESPFVAYDLNNNQQVLLYRFGDRNVARDWLSRRRQARGNYVMPVDGTLNDWALKQSSYGSKAEDIADNPFLSMATSYAELFDKGEGWVQNILRTVPHVGEFSVPFDRVFRPRPTKIISRSETEWLYYDGQESLLHWLVGFRDNPYL